jgi:histidinol phosphatase-like enzyme
MDSNEKKEIKKTKSIYSKLSTNCKHELVFKINDNQNRKMVIDGNYYCPECGKLIECVFKNQYLYTEFKDSKIIDLSKLSLVGDTKTLMKIKDEVLNNKDFYYNCKNINEIRTIMEDKLHDFQYDYSKKGKVLRIFKEK